MRSVLLMMFLSTAAFGQSAIDSYIPLRDPRGGVSLSSIFDKFRQAQGEDAKEDAASQALPDVNGNAFSRYILARTNAPLGLIDAFRLNKLIGSTSGGSGTTTLVSKVSAPSVIGVGVEYGSILQQSNGAVTTLRGNLAGILRLASNAKQFQYCPEVAQQSCDPVGRQLRRLSGSASFEDLRKKENTAAATTDAGPAAADLFGNNFRMSSWGLRFDLTPSNNLDDPKYIKAWHTQILKLRGDSRAAVLTEALTKLFIPQVTQKWKEGAIKALVSAGDVTEFQRILSDQLETLINQLQAADPDFMEKAKTLQRAYSNYFQVRDDLIREAQTHKLSAEYTNFHPLNEPGRSNVRVIYSHQPTQAPTVVTLNFAATMYNHRDPVIQNGILRDIQFAAQMDSRIAEVQDVGPVVLTFAGYYQWMREDALITIGPGNIAPGSGIVLPGTAAKLLNTKGQIRVGQAKLSIPLGGNVKVPLSMTWSNRTELINEGDIRGQVGLTLDLDSLFH